MQRYCFGHAVHGPVHRKEEVRLPGGFACLCIHLVMATDAESARLGESRQVTVNVTPLTFALLLWCVGCYSRDVHTDRPCTVALSRGC